MHPVVPWLPLLLLPVVVAFLGLISFILSRMGWARLAGQYAVAKVPYTVQRELLGYLRIGPVSYKNSARAGITPQGLWLSTWKILYLGHPPLFVPWSAFGPVRAQQFLWARTYATYISSGNDQISFSFSNERVLAALNAFVSTQT
ncbi:hypothetical protein LRS06_16760 [Hymenobacter sp. J193]|uniref:hypothetical protein n=1 Tax=Hymenobacter sp. J193 TaxID=2898429 RepID=UPI002151AB2E|nr:hypothetical protein [Hymenobacter sp. J193]MCR5889389.1 hypothetical protein [Hymenobacter sp. J193]